MQKVKGSKSITKIGVSSVTCESGRKSNHMYGSVKAACTNFLSGLITDIFEHNIDIMNVISGYVETKMLADLPPPNILTALPEVVASSNFKAFKNKKNVICTYPFWRYIMFIVKSVPKFLFKRENL